MTMVSTNNQITIQLPSKYTNLIGAHTKLTSKFVTIEGKVVKGEEDKIFFENGEREEAWRAIPYKLLNDGDFLGISISCPGVTMVVKGRIIKKKTTEKQKKNTWLWEGPGGISISVGSIIERIAPFLPQNAKIEIIIWR